jgi:hypothetical protein
MRVEAPKFVEHCCGRVRTDFHYRTDHDPKGILAEGVEYWLMIRHMVRAGDHIYCEGSDLSWSMAFVVMSQNPLVLDMERPLHLRDPEALMAEATQALDVKSKEAQIEADKTKLAEKIQGRKDNKERLERTAAELNALADAPGLQPAVKFNGPSDRFTIFAYEAKIQPGFQQKEDAEAALNSEEALALIADAREAWKKNNGSIAA